MKRTKGAAHTIALSSLRAEAKRASLDHDPRRRCLQEILDRAAARGEDTSALATRALSTAISQRLAPAAKRKKKMTSPEPDGGWRRTLIFDTEEDAAGANTDRLKNPALPPPGQLVVDYRSLE